MKGKKEKPELNAFGQTFAEAVEAMTIPTGLAAIKISELIDVSSWKEKQNKLVAENPFFKITDAKTYEAGKKHRTNVVKGRTELQNQEKLIASNFAAIRKEVGSETSTLIEITQPLEDEWQEEVKNWEDRKAREKKEKEEAEARREKEIRKKVDDFESDSYTIIQKMTFESIVPDQNKLADLRDDKFDFAEFDVLYDQAMDRVTLSLESKVKTLTENEAQRVRNLELEKENAEAKRISDLQASRLTEIMPYVAFGVALDLTKLGEMDNDEYAGHLSSKKGLFESDAIIKQEAYEVRLAKEEEEKESIYEIRKKRLEDSGMKYSDEHDTFWTEENEEFIILKEDIYEETALEFEDTLVEAKSVIAESIANKVKLKIDSRIEVLKELTFVNFIDAEYTWQLSDKIYVNESILALRDDNWFKEFVQDAKDHLQKLADEQKKRDEELAIADAAKLKAENKARIRKYSKDKETLRGFVKSLEFRDAVPELENEDLQPVLDNILLELDNLKGLLLTNINLF
jgi:hypothetical protein